MQVSRDGKMPIAMFKEEKGIMSPAYPMFEVFRKDELLPEFLMMWFSREEFDREVTFWAVGGVRGSLTWEDFENLNIPVPPIEEQLKIVAEYQAIERRIENNRRLIATLEATAQTIYRHMFVDNIDPENLPQGWRMGVLSDVCFINMGQSPEGDTLNESQNGIIFYQGRTDFGLRYPSVRMFTTNPKKFAKKGDTLLSVRAPVGDINLADNDCCIGRGIASIRSKNGYSSYTYYLLSSLYHEMAKSNDDGTVFGSINKDDLFNLSVIIPEITKIGEFNNLTSQIDNYIAHLCEEMKIMFSMLHLNMTKLANSY